LSFPSNPIVESFMANARALSVVKLELSAMKHNITDEDEVCEAEEERSTVLIDLISTCVSDLAFRPKIPF
jgi:hypothetical protein